MTTLSRNSSTNSPNRKETSSLFRPLSPTQSPHPNTTVTNESINTSHPPHWKLFPSNTATGRLLSRLYGVPGHNGSCIQYPPLKTKPPTKQNNDKQQQQQWKSANYSTRSLPKNKSTPVAIPHFTKKNTQHAPAAAAVDLIPKRKSSSQCHNDISKSQFLQKSYRPPPVGKPIPSQYQNEKERFNDILIHGSDDGLTPFERQWRKDERQRVLRIKAQRRGNVMQQQPQGDDDDDGKELSLFDQVCEEIRERREFQRKMEELGDGDGTRRSIAIEIAERVADLKRLDSRRARGVVRELYGVDN